MKTLVISLVFALTATVNAVSSNNLEGFAYNTEVSEGRVETQTVFKVKDEKYLQNHLKYAYTYDAQERVTSKEVLKWNADKQCFENQYCLNFSYESTEVNVKYVAWNKKANAYADVKAKAVYQIHGIGVNYQSYEWNEKENSWNLLVEHDTHPENVLLIAGK